MLLWLCRNMSLFLEDACWNIKGFSICLQMVLGKKKKKNIFPMVHLKQKVCCMHVNEEVGIEKKVEIKCDKRLTLGESESRVFWKTQRNSSRLSHQGRTCPEAGEWSADSLQLSASAGSASATESSTLESCFSHGSHIQQ